MYFIKVQKKVIQLHLENQCTTDGRKKHHRFLDNIDACVWAAGFNTKDATCLVQDTCLC